jgi:SAM-dependent methyltransferase
MAVYSPSFYAAGHDMAKSSARVVLTELRRRYPFDSVVDFGCGSYAWLNVASELGATVTVGIDSTGVHPDIQADLTEPLDLEQRFDLALCLEVGEHLPEHAAQNLVDNLVEASDLILFSAAIPGQPGVNHISLHWQSWWAALFQAEGYGVSGDIRAAFWDDPEVNDFYRENIFVAELDGPSGVMPLDVVHPQRAMPGWDQR